MTRYDARRTGRTRPRSRSPCATTTRAAGSARSCSSTSRRRPASAASAGSSPRCCPPTRGCSPCSATPATRPTTSLDDGVLRARRSTSSRRRGLAGRDGGARAPRRGAVGRARCCRRRRSPSSAPVTAPRSVGRDRAAAPASTAASPARCTWSTRAAAAAGESVSGRPRTPASRTSASRSTSPWSPCRPTPCSTSVADCADAGVRGLVVVSSGFAETGAAGRERCRPSWSARARAAGMRVIGPNCLGVINTDPQVRLNASLSPVVPPARADRLLLPVRRARRRAARDASPRAGSACRRSSPRATAPTSAATT